MCASVRVFQDPSAERKQTRWEPGTYPSVTTCGEIYRAWAGVAKRDQVHHRPSRMTPLEGRSIARSALR
jgi:hypothetical protein